MAKSSSDEYKVKLSGGGIALDKTISEAVARQIMNLAMGGPAGDVPVTPVPPGGGTAAHHLAKDTSTPKAFLAAKQPKNEIERIACLAYFLTHYRQTPAFKTRDLTDLNIEAAQPKLSNASYAARNATQAVYLSLAGKGQKQITARGEALVDALPDREKARAALESQPGKKRKKTKRAKAAKK